MAAKPQQNFDASGAPLRLTEDSTLWERFQWLIDVIDSRTYAALTPSEKAVLIVYFRRANLNDWTAYPSAQSLASDCGMDKSVTKKARAGLVKRRILRLDRVGGGRDASVYELAPQEEWLPPEPTEDLEAPGPETPAAAEPRADLRQDHENPDDRGVRQITPLGCHRSPPWGETDHPLNEPSKPDQLNVDAVEVDQEENAPTNPEPSPETSGARGGGLFQEHEAQDLLSARGFNVDERARLIQEFGADRIEMAIAQADSTTIHTSYRGYVVSYLRRGYQPDQTIVKQLEKRRAKSDGNTRSLPETVDHYADSKKSEAAWARMIYERLSPQRIEELRPLAMKGKPKWMDDKPLLVRAAIAKLAMDLDETERTWGQSHSDSQRT